MKTIKREDEICVQMKELTKQFVHLLQEQAELMDSLPESDKNEILILETYQFNNRLKGIIIDVFDTSSSLLKEILQDNQ